VILVVVVLLIYLLQVKQATNYVHKWNKQQKNASELHFKLHLSVCHKCRKFLTNARYHQRQMVTKYTKYGRPENTGKINK